VAPNILTGPLRIDALTPNDAPALLYRSDPRVTRFQSWQPESVEDIRAFLVRNGSTAFDQGDAWHQLAVRFADTGKLIGDLAVRLLADGGRQVEIGFTIAPVHQRQGFGTLSVTALLDHLFTVLKKHRVFASVDPRNTASIALLRRVGMRQEAHFRQSLLWKGEWVDDVVYALLFSEWNASTHRGNTVADRGTSQP
jgi:RimJ/RimL family protein N-acetyltransferase